MSVSPQTLSQDMAKELTSGIAIPPQPQIMLDVKKVYPDIDKVAALVSRDPAIGASVLKAVNSPYLGLTKKIVSIEQAVILLGLDSVMNLVNSVMLQSVFSIQLDPKLLQQFWQGTNDTAVAAGLLAKRLGLVRADEAFALGLFHNCAIPLMLEKHSDYLDVLKIAYGDKQARISAIEDSEYKADHATIGYYIARAWNLPSSIVTAIRDHHSAERFELNGDNESEQHVDNLCLILKLAEHITQEFNTIGGQKIDYEWEQHKGLWLSQVQLDEDILADLTDEIMEEVQSSDLVY